MEPASWSSFILFPYTHASIPTKVSSSCSVRIQMYNFHKAFELETHSFQICQTAHVLKMLMSRIALPWISNISICSPVPQCEEVEEKVRQPKAKAKSGTLALGNEPRRASPAPARLGSYTRSNPTPIQLDAFPLRKLLLLQSQNSVFSRHAQQWTMQVWQVVYFVLLQLRSQLQQTSG